MKGISTILAMLLMVIIVISLVALVYTWFSGIFASTTSSAGTALTGTTNSMLTDFSIENAKQEADGNITVDLRNVGTASINTSQIVTYVNNTLYTNDAGVSCQNGGILSPGIICQFNVTGITTSVCGSTLLISAASGFEEYETIDC
jgi:FlaG/FlaF family flagellin (archaellin)